MAQAVAFSPTSIAAETVGSQFTLSGLGLRVTDVVRAEATSCTTTGAGLLLTSTSVAGSTGARLLTVSVPSVALGSGTYVFW